jgi:hypothetical protein
MPNIPVLFGMLPFVHRTNAGRRATKFGQFQGTRSLRTTVKARESFCIAVSLRPRMLASSMATELL